jgi:hypothetical protein
VPLVVTLSDRSPIASGTLRRVYQHPYAADRLVKVIRPEVIERRWGKGSAWYKRWRRVGRFVAVQREVEEYLACHHRTGKRLPFVQQVFGFEETDLGLGFVTEALRGRDGGIAPSLGAIVRSGSYDSRVRAAYERFARDFEESDVVIGDFSADNIVLAWDEAHGERFVLVDGLGCSTLIPLKSWCRPANRWSKRRQLARVRAQLPMIAEPETTAMPRGSWVAQPVKAGRAAARRVVRRLAVGA